MKAFLLMLILTAGIEDGPRLVPEDANAAFYQGEDFNYVVVPPPKFRMVDSAAVADGYSFAFLPELQEYEHAQILIGVNIYKIRGLTFESVIENDTLSIRKHFGADMQFEMVDSVYAATGQSSTAFRMVAPERFLPNAMIAYFDGSTELLIFELILSDEALRFVAEDKFMACLNSVRIQPRKELSER